MTIKAQRLQDVIATRKEGRAVLNMYLESEKTAGHGKQAINDAMRRSGMGLLPPDFQVDGMDVVDGEKVHVRLGDKKPTLTIDLRITIVDNYDRPMTRYNLRMGVT